MYVRLCAVFMYNVEAPKEKRSGEEAEKEKEVGGRQAPPQPAT